MRLVPASTSPGSLALALGLLIPFNAFFHIQFDSEYKVDFREVSRFGSRVGKQLSNDFISKSYAYMMTYLLRYQ